MRRTPLALAVLAFVASALVVTGCATGERPTLAPAPQAGGDEDSAATTVLERLERATSLEFTATYDVIPSLTGDTTQATVVQSGGRRRVTIGDVVYTVDAAVQRTCSGGECVDFLDDARISDLNITHRFWGEAFASRLRLDSSRRTGFSEGSTATIAGHPALCVAVKVPGVIAASASIEYCALDVGVLARYFGADVTIELTSFSFQVDPAQLAG